MHTLEIPPLTLTVLHDASHLAMALTDTRAVGQIAQVPLAPGALQWLRAPSAAASPQAQGAQLYTQLFPEKIRHFLQHSPPRALCLQLDDNLLDIPWEMAFDGQHFLGEKFQVARRIVSDTATATPVPLLRMEVHRASLRVLLVQGASPCPAQADYAQALAAQLRSIESLALTLVALPGAEPHDSPERAALLRQADDSDVVHCIVPAATDLPGSGLWTTLAQQAKPTQLLVGDHASPTVPPWLPTACLRSAPVLLLAGRSASQGTLDFMQRAYRGLAQGQALGEAVRQAREQQRHHAPPASARNPWAARPALYGDSALVLQPATDRPEHNDHLRQVTAMSCDLVESTKLLGLWGPERYSDVLGNYHAACASIVARWGGVSDNPQGDDGMMCYFGIPLAYEDSVARALRAGLELLQAVDQLGVQVRIGVVTGHVVVKAGQPIGVSLHLAARLQSIARPGTLVASDSTRQIVQDKFIFERLQALPQLKGFALATTAYQVLGEAVDHAATAHHRPQRTPFVGRDAELGQLEACWLRLPETGPQTVLVSGEAGMGKSRLVSEFRRGLLAHKHRALECRCTPEHTHNAFQPLIDLLYRRLQLRDGEPVAAKLGKIKARLPPAMVHDTDLALVATLLSIPTEGHLPPLRISADKQRQRTLQILASWLVYATQQGPLCLVVEDLQWIDPSTREFLHRALAEARHSPLLVLATLRSERPAPHDVGFAVLDIALKGLASEATRAMIQSACGPADVPSEMLQLLTDKADGVPLFIEESTRMVMDLGVQAHSHDAALTARFSVPTTIQDLLTARLDRLASAKPVAQVGATIGREFTLALLQAVLSHETSPISLAHLPAQLAALVQSGLVIEKGEHTAAAHTSYYFKHALVRDAAYESLWERDRKRLHRTIATVVREQFQDLAHSQPELLAHHFGHSGNGAQALEYWERAARRAATRTAHLEAINHLRSGLDLLGHLPATPERDRTELRLQLMLASQLIATKGYGADQVGHAYERAAELCQRAGDETAQMKTLLGLEGYHFMRADFSRAHTIAQQAHSLLGANGDPLRKIQLQWAVGNILFHQGEFAATVRQLDACLDAYEQLHHHPSMVQDPGIMCLCYSAWALWEIGLADQALARAEKAVAMAEKLDHKFSMGEAYAFCASVHLFRGEYPQALDCARRARDICAEGGFALWLAYAQLLHGRLLAELEDAQAGAAEMQHAYQQWVSTGAVVTRPLYLAMQAEGLALAGRPDDGLVLLGQAFDMVCQYQEYYHGAEVRRLTGELVLQSARQHGQDRSQEAEQWLLGALEFAREHQHRAAALRCATSLGRLWLTRHRARDAVSILQLEYDYVTEGFYTRDVLAAAALLETLRQASNMPAMACPLNAPATNPTMECLYGPATERIQLCVPQPLPAKPPAV